MIEDSNIQQPQPSVLPDSHWLAGARYPSGTEIWCASHGGEPAWTPDRRRAFIYPSAGSAEMAARLLADGESVPFWAPQKS